ncbi:hypothetical protein BDV95DRAFT_594270 [Massariosphaeria phaeospora]|uniref:Uncharacterized protein n=1 Tax=Massariosphaeria phaeospora TaxID=100035 RepID=A0A7C8MPJ3_9PLEO|nr:hypothetical protein BDV95DRAFT_594270 [Massariosphaeria phaeospora]
MASNAKENTIMRIMLGREKIAEHQKEMAALEEALKKAKDDARGNKLSKEEEDQVIKDHNKIKAWYEATLKQEDDFDKVVKRILDEHHKHCGELFARFSYFLNYAYDLAKLGVQGFDLPKGFEREENDESDESDEKESVNEVPDKESDNDEA